jgi:hypothetical protein
MSFSQVAFAFGACGGLAMILMPSDAAGVLDPGLVLVTRP